MPLRGPSHSRDGRWWWDGSQWLPAFSPDGSLWFDGRRWVGSTGSGRNASIILRPLPVLIGWLVLISAWGLLGAQLNVNGLSPPPHTPFLVFGALFVLSVVAAAPIGFVRRAHRGIELLLWAAIAMVAMMFWYVVMMIASTDPTSDDTAVVGVMLMAVPLWVLLVLLLLAGWGLGRLWRRGRRSP